MLGFGISQDVGHAVLESYSRILESLAHKVMSRIEDVLQADSLAQDPSAGEVKKTPVRGTLQVMQSGRFPNPKEELEKLSSAEAPNSMTLSDFMGWTLDQGENELKKDSKGEELSKDMPLGKPPAIATKKVSYIEKLENLGGLRSPTARH